MAHQDSRHSFALAMAVKAFTKKGEGVLVQ